MSGRAYQRLLFPATSYKDFGAVNNSNSSLSSLKDHHKLLEASTPASDVERAGCACGVNCDRHKDDGRDPIAAIRKEGKDRDFRRPAA
jgi:hypothetical protein